MTRVSAISAAVFSAAAFAWAVPVDVLFPLLQPLMVFLSICTAAVLVRLNRGMPTLDWKALEPHERKRLTAAIVAVTREYLIILALLFTAIFYDLALTALGKERVLHLIVGSRLCSGFAGLIISLCFLRMSYVAWRDYDIVCLQRKLIDLSADRDQQASELASAKERVSAMRSAGLRRQNDSPPRAWEG